MIREMLSPQQSQVVFYADMVTLWWDLLEYADFNQPFKNEF